MILQERVSVRIVEQTGGGAAALGQGCCRARVRGGFGYCGGSTVAVREGLGVKGVGVVLAGRWSRVLLVFSLE